MGHNTPQTILADVQSLRILLAILSLASLGDLGLYLVHRLLNLFPTLNQNHFAFSLQYLAVS
jgi:hypothetical protein